METLTELLRNELPTSLLPIEELIGLEGCAALMEGWGGSKLYIPEKVRQEHPLTQALGVESAEVMAKQYGGCTISVPKGVQALMSFRNSSILGDKANLSAAKLARKYDLTERRVWQILEQSKKHNPAETAWSQMSAEADTNAEKDNPVEQTWSKKKKQASGRTTLALSFWEQMQLSKANKVQPSDEEA